MPEAETAEITGLSHQWAESERRSDPTVLADHVADEFRLIGPLGFILDRAAWEARFSNGLVIEGGSWDDLDVRIVGPTAVVIGTWTQRAAFGENRADGTFRVSQTWTRTDSGWQLLGMQYSAVAGPPGAPS